MRKPVPIFVLGCGRSGTTALTNLLASHRKIAGVQHRLHHGNIECAVCYHDRYWGDISSSHRYLRFLYAISCSDFFLTAGKTVDAFLEDRPADFFDFYLDLMDRHAGSEGASFWVAKLDVLFVSYPARLKEFLARVEKRYGRKPLFVRIEREWRPEIRSYLRMEGATHAARRSWLGHTSGMIVGLARHYTYNGRFARLVKELGGIEMEFEQFKDTKATCRLVADYLEIDANDFPEAVDYRPNTSFHGAKRDKKDGLMVAELLNPIMKIEPVSRAVVRGVEKFRRFQFPMATRILEAEHYRGELKSRLEAEGAEALVKILSNGHSETTNNA